MYNKCLTQLARLCHLAHVNLSSLVSFLLPQPLSLSCSFTKILALGLKPTLLFQVSRPLYKGFPLPGIPCSLLGHSAGLVFLPLRSLLSISSTPNSDLREAWVVLGQVSAVFLGWSNLTLFYSLLNPQSLEQCPEHSRYCE